MTSNRTVLIVGGAGYIGTVLTDHFLKSGYQVRCLDQLLFNNQTVVLPFITNPDYKFIKGDMTDPVTVASSLKGVTDVVMLAGLVGDPITKKYPDESYAINDKGYETMVASLNGHGLDRVIFVSTCSNYGLIKNDELADEEFELSPLSLYAKSKVRIEQNLLGLKGKIDYSPTVLRFATAFGLSPRMRFDLTISAFTRLLYLGEELLVYDVDTWRPYCHVRDFATVIEKVFNAPVDDVTFEVFNAGGDANNFTKQMIVDAILALVPRGNVCYKEHGMDPRNYRVNFAKIRSKLDFTPQYSVEDGIAELVSAMQQGLFHNIDNPDSFFGNYNIDYPIG